MRSEEFTRLYPDIDPTTLPPARWGEAVSLAMAAAAVTYGFAAGQLYVCLIGAGLMILAVIGLSANGLRRIRNEARARFPREDWAEYSATRNLKLQWILPLGWLTVMAISAACLWYVPADYSTISAAICGVLAFLVILILPGVSPMWATTSGDEGLDEYSEPHTPTTLSATAGARASKSTIDDVADTTVFEAWGEGK